RLYQRSDRQARDALRLALIDPLTGLGNQRHFYDRLRRELERARTTGSLVALCLVDVDDFKLINDRFGHMAGDRVLAQLAARFRHDGEAFRLGGDEFAILLPSHEQHTAVGVVEALARRISLVPLDHGEPATISVGVAAYPQHAGDLEELMLLADRA